MMKRRIVLALFLLLAAWALIRILNRSGRDPGQIRLSGNIEVVDAELGFKLPGRVESRLVSEGDTVAAGQIVARLEHKDLLAELSMRQADVESARAILAELEAGSRPEEIAQAQAQLDLAEAERDRAEADFRREKELFNKSVAAAREFETAQAVMKTAEARVRDAGQHLRLLQLGPRQEAIEQAQARLAEARAALESAQVRISYAEIASPFTGIVLSHSIEPGEYVSAGTPVVTVGDLEHPWLRAYLDELDIARVRLGQSAEVSIDAFPAKRYQGRLSFISAEAEFTPKNVQTEKERVKLVYRVKIDVENPNQELKPGMPADAVLAVNPHAG